MSKTYVGDTGTVIQVDVGQDLSSAISVSIKVKKPDEALIEWAGVVVDLTKIQFTTLNSTLDQAGVWKLQSKVVLPTGEWLGDTASFKVFATFG